MKLASASPSYTSRYFQSPQGQCQAGALIPRSTFTKLNCTEHRAFRHKSSYQQVFILLLQLVDCRFLPLEEDQQRVNYLIPPESSHRKNSPSKPPSVKHILTSDSPGARSSCSMETFTHGDLSQSVWRQSPLAWWHLCKVTGSSLSLTDSLLHKLLKV